MSFLVTLKSLAHTIKKFQNTALRYCNLLLQVIYIICVKAKQRKISDVTNIMYNMKKIVLINKIINYIKNKFKLLIRLQTGNFNIVLWF